MESTSGLTGVKKWAAEYRNQIIDEEQLMRDVNEFMRKFDKEQEIERMKEKMSTEPDEDGWIKVTTKGKKKGIPRRAEVTEKILQREAEKNKLKEVPNFYKFQAQNSKVQHLEELKQKFDEDKKRIAVLRATRKFKPY